jgi:sugar transferase (PEP-CTERM/EpsH1 system associated)
MHVVRSLGTGGTEEGVRKLLAGLDRDTFEQTVCTVVAGPVVEPQTGARMVNLGRSAGASGFLVPDLIRVLIREQPHIVHSRNWATIEAVPAARLARIHGVVHSEHGLDVQTMSDQPWRRNMFRHFCFSWADCVFAVSQGLKDYYARQLRRSAERMRVVPNGVDTEHFRPDPAARRELRERLGVSTDTLVVGTVSRLDPVKDHRSLFQAAELSLSQGTRLHLVIVGDGIERAALERDVQGCPLLRQRTLFVGEVRNVTQWINSFDVFALPSLAEGMSNTLLEAMAVGVPPIATRVGGNPDVIEEGRSGLLFEAGDIQTLATCLRALALDPKRRQDLGTHARQRVKSCFSLQVMLRNYSQLYDQVLRDKGIIEPAVRRTKSFSDRAPCARIEVAEPDEEDTLKQCPFVASR